MPTKKKLRKSQHINPDETIKIELSKEDALFLIQDLISEVTNTGFEKLVLKDDDNKFYVFKVIADRNEA